MKDIRAGELGTLVTDAQNLTTVPLAARTAVVTGASSGIGRAIAIRLAAAGADVLVHYNRNDTGAASTAQQIRALGRQVVLQQADLVRADDRQELLDVADRWAAQLGQSRNPIWINNAGCDVLTGDNRELDFLEKLELLWQTDVLATVALSRSVGARMRRSGGVIVNVGWDQAQWGMEGDSGEMFAAIKGAVMAFSQSLAKSLAPEVRVNCVAPGWIQTKWGEQAAESWHQRARSESLAGRWGTPEDVAEVVAFLASDAAAFVVGQIVAVNGGFRGGQPWSSTPERQPDE